MSGPWTQRATGRTTADMVADADEVRRALELFVDPKYGCELMALTSGAFKNRAATDIDGLLNGVRELPDGLGLYFRINPVPVGLSKSAKNGEVVKRRWLYIDVDPVKAPEGKDQSATEAEKNATGEVCDSINEYLREQGWPAPIVTASGNGCGLFYRVDLPNDAMSTALIRGVLYSLADKFNGPKGTIDKSTHNANRLAKLPGTWARKGTHTDARPHRPCRLIYVPDDCGIVSPEMLAVVGGTTGKPPKEPQAPKGPFIKKAGAGEGGQKAYAKAALDGECAAVALSVQPGRNDRLNKAAFKLGTLVAAGLLSEAEVVARLTTAGRDCKLNEDSGCGESGIQATIQSGLQAGKLQPREIPERNGKHHDVGSEYTEKAKKGEVRLTHKMSTIKPQTVEWLVRNRVPKKFITVFAGQSGIGKSFVACDLIARISTGSEIPGGGGECFEPGGSLIISEDSHEFVLAPRLIAMRANMDRINVMTWEAMGNYFLGNTEMLEAACNEVEGGVSLVMIDPPTNFLDDVDEHKNSEVRQLVMKVVEWCFSRDLAIIFILHINKQTGKGVAAINRVMGSVAWVSTARVAHSLCDDPNDPARKLWVVSKNNLGPIIKGLAYRIDGEPAVIEWLGEVDTTADEALGGEPKKRKRHVIAADWLIDRFRDKREWLSEDLFDAARAENISRNAIYEAKDTLNLPKARREVRENGEVRWVWWVPEGWAPIAPIETVGQLGQLELSD